MIWWSRKAWLCDLISIRRYLSIKCKSCTVWYFGVDTEHAVLTYELCTCLKNTWFIRQCTIMKLINRIIFIINEMIYFNCLFFVNVTLWNHSYFKLIIIRDYACAVWYLFRTSSFEQRQAKMCFTKAFNISTQWQKDYLTFDSNMCLWKVLYLEIRTFKCN